MRSLIPTLALGSLCLLVMGCSATRPMAFESKSWIEPDGSPGAIPAYGDYTVVAFFSPT